MSYPADPARTGPVSEPFLRPPEDRREARALLVEDERIVGVLLAEFLRLEGYEVDRAMDGREALELVRRRVYALIVSDVRMPYVDGPALYQELQAMSPEMTRRMVFVTGDIMGVETRELLDETSLRYIEKPFTLADFRAVLRGVRGDPADPGSGAAGLI